MIEFARALPNLRARSARHLSGRAPTRAPALAGAVRLLDRGFFRIGGESFDLGEPATQGPIEAAVVDLLADEDLAVLERVA